MNRLRPKKKSPQPQSDFDLLASLLHEAPVKKKMRILILLLQQNSILRIPPFFARPTFVDMLPSPFLSNMSKASLKAANSSGFSLTVVILKSEKLDVQKYSC